MTGRWLSRHAKRWLALSLLLGACGRADPPRHDADADAEPSAADEPPRALAPTVEPRPADYVGSEVCSRCHAAQQRRWLGSHHDRAMQEPAASAALGPFAGELVESSAESLRFVRAAQGLAVEVTPRGGVPRRHPVRYLFGVDPLQQVLLELDGGRLQALTTAWDARPAADGGQRWFLLGDDVGWGDAMHWAGPAYNWNGQCAACHSTGVERGYDHERERFATRFAAIDVGCEACHGPGSAHVEWAEAGATGSDRRLAHALTKPAQRRWEFADGLAIARLSTAPDRGELEVCGPCHSRRADLGPGAGAGYHDRYRLELLDDPLYFADGQIRDEVFELGSFLQSKMHAAGVVCSDCHDPHSLELRAASATETCASCHRAEVFDRPSHHFHAPDSEAARCESCHMPARVYMGVDARRDHRFSVPQPELSARVGAPDPCLACHDDRDAAWAGAAIDRQFGDRAPRWEFAGALWLARAGQPEAARSLAAIVDGSGAPAIIRATALVELARFPSPTLAALIHDQAHSEHALVRRAAATAAAVLPIDQRERSIRPLLHDPARSVRLEAVASLLGADTSRWSAPEREAYQGALAEYRAAKLHTADRVESLVDLAALELIDGQPERARGWLERALASDPSFTAAHLNLADLERGLGREAEAEARLRAALDQAAEPALVHHALGLALVRSRRTSEALVELERAYALAPTLPRMGYVYAVGLFDEGQREAAMDVLERVHERHPGDAEVLAALVAFSRELGRVEDAKRYSDRLRSLAY